MVFYNNVANHRKASPALTTRNCEVEAAFLFFMDFVVLVRLVLKHLAYLGST